MKLRTMVLLGVMALALSPVTASADHDATMQADGPEYAPHALVLDVSADTLVQDLVIAFYDDSAATAAHRPTPSADWSTLCDMAREGSTPTVTRSEHLGSTNFARLDSTKHDAEQATLVTTKRGGLASIVRRCR